MLNLKVLLMKKIFKFSMVLLVIGLLMLSSGISPGYSQTAQSTIKKEATSTASNQSITQNAVKETPATVKTEVVAPATTQDTGGTPEGYPWWVYVLVPILYELIARYIKIPMDITLSGLIYRIFDLILKNKSKTVNGQTTAFKIEKAT